MGDEGVKYQKKVRGELSLEVVDKKAVLVMGGGEGVGSLSAIFLTRSMWGLWGGTRSFWLFVGGMRS